MSTVRGRTAPTYGPNPWQQTQWDWRAAGNFIGGGAGAGLIVSAVVAGAEGAALAALMLFGVALIGLGLLCVWAEIGRPLRALNVFFNPRTSWMTREAIVATLLMPVALLTVTVAPALKWLVLLLALGFIYCQARIVRGARGIPAWREPMVVPLLGLTALAEGAGLSLLLQPQAVTMPMMLALAGGVWVARALAWSAYRRRVAVQVVAPALAALDGAGRWLQWGGGLLPLALLAMLAGGTVEGPVAVALLAVAGLAAAATGAWVKYTLITRAGFNQGFALAHLPVRGVRR